MSQLYFLTFEVNIADQTGIDLSGTMEKINELLASYSNATTCLHKYKVVGEPRVIAVFEVSNVIGLERMISGIARIGNIKVTSKPMIRYQKFAEFLGVKEELCIQSDNTLSDDVQLFWLEFTVEYPGKSMEELLNTWRNEAVFALTARTTSGNIELFKSVAERKVQVFIGMGAEDLDGLLFNLPVMKENGDGVKVVNHALQSLDNYCSRISSEEL